MKEFFFIGSGKTGSSWLQIVLASHPQLMFGFPENLKSYFFEKTIEEIENLNSNFEFENPIKNTKSIIYFNESMADTFYHTVIGHEIYLNIDQDAYHENIIRFIKKIKANIEIIITDRIRDNDFLISYYSQALKQGCCIHFSKFKSNIKSINEYDYKKIY